MTDPITFTTHDGTVLAVYVTAGGALTVSSTDDEGSTVAALTEAQSDRLWAQLTERRQSVS